jgi:beta-glucosidase
MTKTPSRLSSADQPFLWGVATSAFQIEGHLENDMTEWERLGKFSQNGKDPRYKNAVDHWQRREEDFALLKLAEKFADRIDLFVSFNEPLVWALAA